LFAELNLAEDRRGFIGSQVLPTIPVEKASGTFPVYPRENLKKQIDTRHAAGAAYSQSKGQIDNASFDVLDYGHEVPVYDRIRNQYKNQWNLDANAADESLDIVLRDREIRIAAAMQNTGTFTNTAATAAFSDRQNATPIDDCKARISVIELASGLTPDCAIMNIATYRDLVECDQIKEHFQYTQGQLPSIDQVAAALHLQRIIIAGSLKNANAEGQAFSGARIWDATKVVIAKLMRPASTIEEKNPGLGCTFVWTGDGAGENGIVEQRRDDAVRCDFFRARMNLVEKIIAPECSNILTGC
jgi:hypothetical protein